VTGASRMQALQRAARALEEFEVGGMPTVLPFHRAVVTDPAFAAPDGSLRVHTRWIETEFSASLPAQEPASVAEPADRESLTVEVDGKRLEVTVPRRAPVSTARSAERPRRASRQSAAAPAKDTLITPMQGTIIKIAVAEGQQVHAGDPVVVLEAMKMEQPLTAHKDGTIAGLSVSIGQTVTSGEPICQITD
jgi:acetyl-CoA/propionyl-CoA carboxylase biotin carboxyl carrier protein